MSLRASPGPTFAAHSAAPLLPRPKNTRSFSHLARLIGIGGSTVDVAEDDVEDDDEGDVVAEVDEDTLLWDAQTALIGHHPALAVKHYTTAALPPHRSPAACLALGNVLLRGSGFSHTEAQAGPSSTPLEPAQPAEPPNPTGAGWIYNRLFSPSLPVVPPSAPRPERKDSDDLVGNSWSIRKEGKRAVRDVEAMGVAGAWYVLGLGWVLEAERELQRRVKAERRGERSEENDSVAEEDENILVIDYKGKARARTPLVNPSHGSVDPEPSSRVDRSVSGPNASGSGTGTGDTEESSMIRTPGAKEAPSDMVVASIEDQRLKLLYDLLQPLLHLYRNGHIQSPDPVALPPIAPMQLPSVLQPQGDLQKRRNVWHLGGVVAASLISLSLVSVKGEAEWKDGRKREQRRKGVAIMAHYILGMTKPEAQREDQFRTIVSIGHTGLEGVDDLVRQAAKRLDILVRSPTESMSAVRSLTGRPDGYPFPAVTPSTETLECHHQTPASFKHLRKQSNAASRSRQHPSVTSLNSISSQGILPTPIKSAASSASLITEQWSPTHLETSVVPTREDALETLQRVADQGQAVMPSRRSRKMKRAMPSADNELDGEERAERCSPSSETAEEAIMRSESSLPTGKKATQRPAVPSIGHHTESAKSAESTSNSSVAGYLSETNTHLDRNSSSPRSLHSLSISAVLPHKAPSSELLLPQFPQIASIDPSLAAAELASTLTTHVCCSVCTATGVNFPECRRCGMRFCSRECRVGVAGGGDGKRHVCRPGARNAMGDVAQEGGMQARAVGVGVR